MPRLWRSEALPCTTTTLHTWVPHRGCPLYPGEMARTAWHPLNISQVLTRKMALKRVRPIGMRSNGAQVTQRRKNPRWSHCNAGNCNLRVIKIAHKANGRQQSGSGPKWITVASIRHYENVCSSPENFFFTILSHFFWKLSQLKSVNKLCACRYLSSVEFKLTLSKGIQLN